MSVPAPHPPHSPQDPLERRLALTLNIGTWFGSAVIGIGLLASVWSTAGSAIEMAGVAIFILLPIIRVALMLSTFARRRERLFASLAALVLAIIVGGAAASLYLHAH
jgi:uncharacterized membrane protein